VAHRLLPETLPQRGGEPISLSSMVRGYGAVLRHRGFLAYLGILTISYAGLFAWISGGPVVLQGVYGLSALAFGFTFALGAAGYMAGATIAARIARWGSAWWRSPSAAWAWRRSSPHKSKTVSGWWR
jgi:DHA1 family bicyclomycin/chloramphenicol resistance-like MFS transporter